MADTGAYLTVIKNFLMQKARGEAMTITGDGEQTRDFTHVRDIVRANIKAMESQKPAKENPLISEQEKSQRQSNRGHYRRIELAHSAAC